MVGWKVVENGGLVAFKMPLEILQLIFGGVFVSTEGLRFQMLNYFKKKKKSPMEINACIFRLKSKPICNCHSKEPDHIFSLKSKQI